MSVHEQLVKRLACSLPPNADGRALAVQLANGILADCTLRVTTAHGGPARPTSRRSFPDGRSHTAVAAEPDGRIAIEGYDGELCVHRATYNTATAEAIGLALIDAVKEVRDVRAE